MKTILNNKVDDEMIKTTQESQDIDIDLFTI